MPVISLNYPPAQLAEVNSNLVAYQASSEHAMVSFEMANNNCQVLAIVFAPTMTDFVFAAGVSEIPMDAIGRFLDARRNFPTYRFGLGLHLTTPSDRRLLPRAWNCDLMHVLSADALAEQCRGILREHQLASTSFASLGLFIN